MSITTTISQTETTTLAPQCVTASSAFRAVATQYNNSPFYMYAYESIRSKGAIMWIAGSASTSDSIQNRYMLSLDSNGYLRLAYNLYPYTRTACAYISTAYAGNTALQFNLQPTLVSQIASGAKIAYVKGCIDPSTGALLLDADGRKKDPAFRHTAINVLW